MNAISTAEKKLLAVCETGIQDGLKAFLVVGRHLLTIRDKKLYLESADTFEEYCNKRWNFTRQRAHQLIDGAKAVDAVSTIVDTPPPVNEAQARVLATLPSESAQATVWAKAVETAPKDSEGNPKVTAAHVQRVADEVTGKPPKTESNGKAPPDKETIAAEMHAADLADPEPEPTVSEQCEADNKLIESFCRSIMAFYENNVPHTTWTSTDGRIGSGLASLKAGCNTLRTAKSVICPGCDADGCQYCDEHGYLPKYRADQVARVAT